MSEDNLGGNWSIPPEGMTRRDWLLSRVTNPKARNLVNELFREGATEGDGGTAAALKKELENAEKAKHKALKAKGQTGGGSKGDSDIDLNVEIEFNPRQLKHYQKADDRSREIKKLLDNKKEILTLEERRTLEELLERIIGGYRRCRKI